MRRALGELHWEVNVVMVMGVGERHEQGRHKWISVRQNSLSYTLSKKVSIISIIKLIKS